MNFLETILANNCKNVINENGRDDFGVVCFDGELTIHSNISNFAKKSKQRKERAIKKLQSKIGGKFTTNVFDEPQLMFDVSNIKSARCNQNPSIFSFKECVEVVCQENNGVITVPLELLTKFESEFPTLTFKGEKNKFEFIEYDGSYPTLCGGDTILKSGETIIKTKIINHQCTKFTIDIPTMLKEVELPPELLAIDNQQTSCCGGCD